MRGVVKKSEEVAMEFWAKTGFWAKRKPRDAEDWGDQATIRMQLKRKGRTLETAQDGDYGVYLGDHSAWAQKKPAYVVGLKPITSFKLIGVEIFSSVEDMKAEWMLD
jgi:hypothetical protein